MSRVVLATFVIAILAARADAQSSAIAEQLFNEARELGKAGKWTEACPKFEASFKQDPALGTRLNLANCYERIGRLASAWGTYRDAATFAQKAGDAKRADYAQKQALLLEPRLPKLTITAPSTQPTGFAVTRDGAAVSTAELGLALYVDPGAHEVAASAPGFVSFSQKITLVEGKADAIVIPDLVAKPEEQTPVATPVVTTPVVEDAPVSPTRKYIGLGVGGAGLVAVGVGLVFGKMAMSANDDAEELCGAELQCSAANFDAGKKLIDDGRTKGTISTVMVVAGGAAVVAGVVIFITAPRATERATAARIIPVIDRESAGIGLVGSF